MRTIIAGSRNCMDYGQLLHAISEITWIPTVIVSGTAKGVDRMGEQWAEENGIPVERYPANWSKYGKSAGYKRNTEMAQRSDALLALWDFESRGTKHMIDLAKKYKLIRSIWRIM